MTHLFFDGQVMILITGAHKAFALYKAIEEGVNHMWTVSAFQQHRHTLFICDEDATLELRVKTVKYFKVCKMKFHMCFSGHSSAEVSSL
jgi:glucosamine-6-phosphate deaminase